MGLNSMQTKKKAERREQRERERVCLFDREEIGPVERKNAKQIADRETAITSRSYPLCIY